MTQGERIATVENKVDNLQEDVTEIKTDVSKIAIEMPALLRKVGDHHEVFHDHVTLLENLQAAECPSRKVFPGREEEDNGERGRRREDQPKNLYTRWGLIVALVGLALSNMGACVYVSKAVTEFLDKMPK